MTRRRTTQRPSVKALLAAMGLASWLATCAATAPGQLSLEIGAPREAYLVDEPRGHADLTAEGIARSVMCLSPGREYSVTANLT